MSELETVIKGSAEAREWTADWDEVLRRAGRAHPRYRSRGAAAIAAVAAVAVVLALPGIGIGGGLNAWISSSRPGITLSARLTLPSGQSAGTLSVRFTRLFVTADHEGKPFFVPRGHRSGLPPVPMRWSLDLRRGESAGSAVIRNRRGKLIARLCAPCSDGAHGTIELRARWMLSTFRAVALVQTSAGIARGMLRFALANR